MRWQRILVLFALSCAVVLVALWFVPGAKLTNLFFQAGCVFLLPWLAALVSFPLKVLGRSLLDAFRRVPRGGETSARVLASLGGLTWVAGLLGLFGTFHAALISIAESRGAAESPVIPGIIAAMLVPVAFALILRLTLYDRAARALETAGGARETVPAN